MKKGFTLAMLIITIIVMIIIASAIIIYMGEMPDRSNAMIILDEMKIVQSKVYEYELNHQDNSTLYPYKGTAYSGTLGDITYSSGYYKLSADDLKDIGVSALTNVYIVNYETQDVIFEKGISINGVTYFSIDDINAQANILQ